MNQKIFILHGWTYNKSKWLPLKQILEKDKNINVEILDIPGLTGKIDRPWTVDDYVNWLYQIIKKEKQKCYLIGGSNGGRISLNFVIKYPEYIKQLFIIDSAGIYRSDILYRSKNFIFKMVAKAGKLFTDSTQLRSMLYKLNRDNDYISASDIMKKTLVNMITSDKYLDLTKVNIPTTIIWGNDDKATPLWMGQKMNKLIKGSKLNIVAGARHSPQFTNTEEVADFILKSLSFRATSNVA